MEPDQLVDLYLHNFSYMSAHVLLNLLNELGEKGIKCEVGRDFISFSQQV